MRNKEQYWEFVVEDADDLSGNFVGKFVQTVLEHRPARCIIVRDLEGAITGFQDRTTFSYPVEDFMIAVRQAQQYNWGFFFLVSEVPSAFERLPDEDLIKLSSISIQLVDSGWIYLYTADHDVIKAVTRAYPHGKVRCVPFNQLEIPY